MKKIVSVILIAGMCLSLAACSSSYDTGAKLQESQMKNICELATVKCYYHNVAKYFDEDVPGFWLFKKDRKFWMEYAGVVTIGIDASMLKIEIDDDTVTISLPPAKVFGCTVDPNSLTEESFIISPDSAPVTVDHQQKAFEEAQRKLLETAKHDTSLLISAQQRAQKLLEDYVLNIGSITGKTYKVNWVYIDSGATPSTSGAEA